MALNIRRKGGSKPKPIPLGSIFGKLTVVGDPVPVSGKAGVYMVQCRCECGSEKDVLVARLRHGVTKSCGCMAKWHPMVSDNPALMSEWDFELNDRDPATVSSGSAFKAHWKCNQATDHRWQSKVCHRAKGIGCPFCANRKVCASNCLETTHSLLSKEWDIQKNSKRPCDVTQGSTESIWWKCFTNPTHGGWRATVRSRTRVSAGCPACSESKGEKGIDVTLDNLGVLFKREWKFPTCRNRLPLPFDFVLFTPKASHKVKCIEYNGKQHYESMEFFGGKKFLEECQGRDRIKQRFCLDSNIPLLVIPYWQYDNIQKLVEDFVNAL